jgi:mono/diheme cytochrome c family protein
MKINRLMAGAAMIAAAVMTHPAAAIVRAQSQRSQWDGIYSEAQAKRGETLYVENCANCHAADLSGSEIAPPLTAVLLASARWKDKPLAEFFELMRVTMPWNSPGGLSAQQNADILAFILQRARYPHGNVELPATADALAEIRIRATQP